VRVVSPVFDPNPKSIVTDPRTLEANRVVAWTKEHSCTRAFDILRTKVLSTMRSQRWSTIGITSPGQDCGKTTVSLNLAFSLSNQLPSRVMLMDFDLRQPRVARLLGINWDADLGRYLQEEAPVPICLVKAGESAFYAVLHQGNCHDATELIGLSRTDQVIKEFGRGDEGAITVCDLPPVLSTDDTIAMLPKLDCALLVIREGVTRKAEVLDALRAVGQTNLLGVVLNGSGEKAGAYY